MKRSVAAILAASLAAVLLISSTGCSSTPELEFQGEYNPESFSVCEAGEANVALNKLVLSDSAGYVSPFNSEFLVDGRINEFGFASGESADPEVDHCFTVDLEKAYDITGVKMYAMEGYEKAFPREMEVFVSSDGENFKSVGKYSGSSVGKKGADVSFKESDVRYVRVRVTKYGDYSSVNAEGSTVYYYAIGEIEVTGKIDNTENIVISKPGMWMDKGATETLAVSYRVESNKGNAVEWYSTDESVVTVDKNSGTVKAVAPGNAIIHAYDGKNLTACNVKVKDDAPAYSIGIYYNANHGKVNEQTVSWLKDFGVDYVEIDHYYDSNRNNMKSWLVNKLAGYGIGSVIPDSMRYTITEEQDETIIERYSAYKNQEGFVGFMIWDEPITVAPYGRPARLLSQLGFDAIVNVNLSPEDPGKFDEKIYDYMSAVNMEGLKYLTYDQYPYAAGRKDFAPNVYYSLDALRKAGLAYNSDTGCYLQAFESAAVRKSTDSELLFNMSAAVSYGVKNFKWFLWFTPAKYFTDALLDLSSQKSDMFDGGAAVNKKLHELGKYLADTDAVYVYHTDKTSYTEQLPENFPIGFGDGTSAIVSVFRERLTGRNYIGVANKNFNTDDESVIEMNIGDMAVKAVIDSDGNRRALTDDELSEHVLKLSFAPGDIKLLELAEGVDLYGKKTGNIALNAGIWASSSILSGSSSYDVSAYEPVDGKKDKGCWRSAVNDRNRSITVLLGDFYEINEVVLYGAVKSSGVGENFPESVDILVSSDNVTYTKVASASSFSFEADDHVTIGFDKADNVKYVKLEMPYSQKAAEIGEIEIYCR